MHGTNMKIVILWIRYIKIFSILEPENKHFKGISFLKRYKICYVTYTLILWRVRIMFILPRLS